MRIHMTPEDMDLLVETSTAWGDDWRAQDGRFECDNPLEYGWAHAYWIGNNPAALIIFKSYLIEAGWKFQVLFDTAEQNNGSLSGWVVVTDWEAAR